MSCRGSLQDLSILHPNVPPGTPAEMVVVGYQDESRAGSGSLIMEHLHDLVAGCAVEIARWLIGKKQGRRVRQRPRYGNPLPLSPGKSMDAGVCPRAEADLSQQIQRPLFTPGCRDGPRQHGYLYILASRQHRDEIVHLKNKPDFFSADPVELPPIGSPDPVEADLS